MPVEQALSAANPLRLHAAPGTRSAGSLRRSRFCRLIWPPRDRGGSSESVSPGTGCSCVRALMTRSAEGDQILFRIMAEITSPPHVMDVEICHGSAALTAPPISIQDSLPESLVPSPLHANRSSPSSHGTRVHDSTKSATGDTSSRRKRTVAFSISFASRAAPARKSAQIISSM